jgi:hypothetical protein
VIDYHGHIRRRVDAEGSRVIIQYRNPQRPDEGAIRFIPNPSEIEAEKQRLERLGFVIIDISTPYFQKASGPGVSATQFRKFAELCSKHT